MAYSFPEFPPKPPHPPPGREEWLALPKTMNWYKNAFSYWGSGESISRPSSGNL